MERLSTKWRFILFAMLSITWAAALAVAATPPDNSAINARDTKGGPPTSEDQSNQAADLKTTQKIRQALTDDKTLSVDAKNIKVITISGVVTLRGPVKTDDEKSRIATLANQVAGEAKINNQLEVIGVK